MRRTGIAFVLLASIVSAIASSARASDGPSYEQLVAKAEADDMSIDYTELRQAYARSKQFDPYGFATMKSFQEMAKSFDSGDCTTVLAKAEEILKSDYIFIPAHILRSRCFDKVGDGVHSAHEDAVAHSLSDSILSSGDGQSTKSAFVVVTMDEERYVLVTKGLPEERQALVADAGHSYDAIEGTAKTTGAKAMLYFQIDAILAGEAKLLGGAH